MLIKGLMAQETEARELDRSWIQSPQAVSSGPRSTPATTSQDSLTVYCACRGTGPVSLSPRRRTGGPGRLSGIFCLPSAQKDEGMELAEPTTDTSQRSTFASVQRTDWRLYLSPNCWAPAGTPGWKAKGLRKVLLLCFLLHPCRSWYKHYRHPQQAVYIRLFCSQARLSICFSLRGMPPLLSSFRLSKYLFGWAELWCLSFPERTEPLPCPGSSAALTMGRQGSPCSPLLNGSFLWSSAAP